MNNFIEIERQDFGLFKISYLPNGSLFGRKYWIVRGEKELKDKLSLILKE